MKTIFNVLGSLLMTSAVLCPTLSFAQSNNPEDFVEKDTIDEVEMREDFENQEESYFTDEVSSVDNIFPETKIYRVGNMLYIENYEKGTEFRIFNMNGHVLIYSTYSPIDISMLENNRIHILKAGPVVYTFRK